MEILSKGAKYDKMVYGAADDELGLFEKYEETFIKVRDRIDSYNVKSIIDFGCGTGNLCGALSEKNNVIGIDKNLDMIKEGKSKFPKMNFIESSILDISNIENKADIVVSSFVLHGLTEDDQRKVLANMLFLSHKKRIILIDYMFENLEARQNYKDELLRNGKTDLWEFLKSKNYFIVENLKKYIDQLALKISFEHVANFTWIAEIYE